MHKSTSSYISQKCTFSRKIDLEALIACYIVMIRKSKSKHCICVPLTKRVRNFYAQTMDFKNVIRTIDKVTL